MAQIGENADLKRNARRTVEHQALRRHFHNHAVASFFHHLRKILLDRIGLRRRICGRDPFLPDDRLDGADQAHFISHAVKDRLDHVCGRRFPLRPGDPDYFQFLRRISEISRRHQRQRIPRIFHPDHGHMFRRFHIPLHNDRRRAFFCHVGDIFMPVGHGAADADKDRSCLHFSRIVDQRRYFNLIASLSHLIFQALQ